MARFILVPGAWHGAWCWARLAPKLRAGGHEVETPDLAPVPPGANPLPLWAAQIAGLATSPAILVGHSRGGMVIGEAAELDPSRLRKLIYISGFLLPPGGTMQLAMSRPEAGAAPDYLRPARGRAVTLDPAIAAARFCPQSPDADLTLLQPEPLGSFSAPATLTPARFGQVPRAYIECAADQVLPLALQRAMQADWPCAERLALPSDHSPFLSHPEALAEALLSLAR